MTSVSLLSFLCHVEKSFGQPKRKSAGKGTLENVFDSATTPSLIPLIIAFLESTTSLLHHAPWHCCCLREASQGRSEHSAHVAPQHTPHLSMVSHLSTSDFEKSATL